MKTCPNCKASVIDTAKFCNKCRFNIKKYEDEQASSVSYCTECGAEIQPNSAFCTECGADVVCGEATSSCENEISLNLDGIANLSGLANEQMYAQSGFTVENGVLTSYTGKKRTITIFGSIEEIYDSAFEGNQTITCVEIEEGIKSIGRKAFASCPSLIEINIPKSCRIIYEDSFKDDSLRTLILPTYNENVIYNCVSDLAKKYFDDVDMRDFCEEIDGKTYVSIEKINKNAVLIKKYEEEEIAKEKRAAEQKRRAVEKRKKEEEERNSVYNKYNPGTIHKMGIYNHGTQLKDIEWRVLERNGDKALLISNYIIDRQKFNENSEHTSWEKCSLRKWLNNDFYNIAFSSSEKSKILTTSLKNAPNPQHGTSSGGDTYDKIFLLSMDEVKKYFLSDAYTKCQVTLFAKNKGAYCDTLGYGCWWLRTPGEYSTEASYIFYSGGVSTKGYDVTGTIFGVRPAMWISIG